MLVICSFLKLSRCPRAGRANTFGIAPKVFKNASQNNHFSRTKAKRRPGILAGQRALLVEVMLNLANPAED